MTHPRQNREDRANDVTLLEAAGIHVYSRKFIEWYMRYQSLGHAPGLITRRAGEYWAENVRVFFPGLVAAVGIWLCFWSSDLFPGVPLSLSVPVLGACTLAGFAGAYAALERGWCRPVLAWETHELGADGAYKTAYRNIRVDRKVPDFALGILRRIRQVLPDCAFEIRVLGSDPIIECVTPRGRYAVLVYEGTDTISEP